VREDDFEAYVMAELAGDLGAVPYYGNIGVRMVDVTTGSTAYSGTTSWNGTANVTDYKSVYAPSHYFRVLPSLNLNFDLMDKLAARGRGAGAQPPAARRIARQPEPVLLSAFTKHGQRGQSQSQALYGDAG
jgi:hypothetical protein